MSTSTGRKGSIADVNNIAAQSGTLDDLRIGTIKILVATSVCEEGIDISACNFVICLQPPDNLRSFVQRRGRARAVKSTFTIMFAEHERTQVEAWHELEEEMRKLYLDDMRQLDELKAIEHDETFYRELVVESTG